MQTKIILASEGDILMQGRQIIKLKASDTSGGLSILFSLVPAGSGIPPHVHTLEDETFQITEGELEVNIGGDIHRLTTGDMIFMPRNIPHSFKAITETSMWVILNPAGGEQMFTEIAGLPPGAPDMAKVAQIAAKYGVSFI